MNRRWFLPAVFILTSLGMFILLIQNGSQAESQLATASVSEAGIKVWKTARSLKQGERVKPSDLAAAEISREQAALYKIDSNQAFELKPDSRIRADIAEGEIVLPSQLLTPDQPEYQDYLLTDGRSPFPITIETDSKVPYSVAAGDLVDVMLIAMPNKNISAHAVQGDYQGIRVTPILNKRELLQITVDEDRGRTRYTFVLALDQQESARLMLARQIGVIDINKSSQSHPVAVELRELAPALAGVAELRGKKPSEKQSPSGS